LNRKTPSLNVIFNMTIPTFYTCHFNILELNVIYPHKTAKSPQKKDRSAVLII